MYKIEFVSADQFSANMVIGFGTGILLKDLMITSHQILSRVHLILFKSSQNVKDLVILRAPTSFTGPMEKKDDPQHHRFSTRLKGGNEDLFYRAILRFTKITPEPIYFI